MTYDNNNDGAAAKTVQAEHVILANKMANEIVSNCHKVPQKSFTKRLLTVIEIVNTFNKSKILTLNCDTKRLWPSSMNSTGFLTSLQRSTPLVEDQKDIPKFWN